jgi:hypothetical protein
MGWILQSTPTKTSDSISIGLELGFNHLADNIPVSNERRWLYHEAVIMHSITDEVVNSDTLITYLVAANICNNVVQVIVAHLIARYSTDFGGSDALYGKMLALLGEMVGDQLPMLVKFMDDPEEDLIHALAMKAVIVPSDAQVEE